MRRFRTNFHSQTFWCDEDHPGVRFRLCVLVEVAIKQATDLLGDTRGYSPKGRSRSSYMRTRPLGVQCPLLFVCNKALSSWWIPWLLGRHAIAFLLSRHQLSPMNVDARLALPQHFVEFLEAFSWKRIIAFLMDPFRVDDNGHQQVPQDIEFI